jgi:hypothetical protein
MDPLVSDLASRYCPVDKALFLDRLGALAVVFALSALLLVLLARFIVRGAPRKDLAYVAACAIVVFTMGSCALVIFGLTGCGEATTPGLNWDSPW